MPVRIENFHLPLNFFRQTEQLKYLVNHPTQTRYHPMIIKYCLALQAKSPAAYEQLRLQKDGTGVLVLPSKRTLRDYRNYIRPQRGFNGQLIKELTRQTSEFSSLERYIVLSFNEMKIQNDLVWDKHTGELIGFVDLGDTNLNFATFQKVDTLVSHILVFYVRSVMNPLSYAFASFATAGIKSFQLFPLFWRAVAILERTCKLKVIAATADGASPNQCFYNMHMSKENENGNGTIYKARNIYANDDVSFGSFQIHHILLKQPLQTPFTNLDLLEIRGTCGITTGTYSGVSLLIYIMKIRSVT